MTNTCSPLLNSQLSSMAQQCFRLDLRLGYLQFPLRPSSSQMLFGLTYAPAAFRRSWSLCWLASQVWLSRLMTWSYMGPLLKFMPMTQLCSPIQSPAATHCQQVCPLVPTIEYVWFRVSADTYNRSPGPDCSAVHFRYSWLDHLHHYNYILQFI